MISKSIAFLLDFFFFFWCRFFSSSRARRRRRRVIVYAVLLSHRHTGTRALSLRETRGSRVRAFCARVFARREKKF